MLIEVHLLTQVEAAGGTDLRSMVSEIILDVGATVADDQPTGPQERRSDEVAVEAGQHREPPGSEIGSV